MKTSSLVGLWIRARESNQPCMYYTTRWQQSRSSQSPLFLESYANMHVKKQKFIDQKEFNQNMCSWVLKDKIKMLNSFCSNLIKIRAFLLVLNIDVCVTLPVLLRTKNVGSDLNVKWGVHIIEHSSQLPRHFYLNSRGFLVGQHDFWA